MMVILLCLIKLSHGGGGASPPSLTHTDDVIPNLVDVDSSARVTISAVQSAALAPDCLLVPPEPDPLMVVNLLTAQPMPTAAASRLANCAQRNGLPGLTNETV